jgi:hypothetical protein
VSTEKQICTFMEDGIISVSEEYELSLLGQLADQYLGSTEIAYLSDPIQLVDQLVVKGLNSLGNPVLIVHDFYLKDERSPHGQGSTEAPRTPAASTACTTAAATTLFGRCGSSGTGVSLP